MSRQFLNFTVFITGMSVMAVELTASRLLAPYFGTSLFIWTNLIAVVMAALALGYYLGGRLADHHKGTLAPKILYPIILTTGIFTTLIPFVGRPIFLFAYAAIPEKNLSLFLSSLIATFILFFVPLLLLGMVTPLAARMGFKKLDTAGSVIGSLYAFSTLGSIIGTFLPVLFTIPFLGSRETFFLFGGLLILLGVFGTRKAIFLSFIAFPIAFFFFAGPIHASPTTEFEGESVYNYIRVQKKPDGTKTLHTNEGLGVQSLYHPFFDLTGYYWDAAAFLPALNPKGKDFLIIGTAGASSARVLHKFFPYLQLEGVEIDPLMIEVGNKYFGASEIPITINENDGRVFLDHSKKQYDFIMVDVYRDELYIPFHLATKEFFESVRDHLAPNGAMMMNIATTSPEADLLQLISNTVTAAFPFVYEYRTPNSGNSLLFAFQEKPVFTGIPFSSYTLGIRSLLTRIARGIKPIIHDPGKTIATDNKSSVEFLTEKMIFSEIP